MFGSDLKDSDGVTRLWHALTSTHTHTFINAMWSPSKILKFEICYIKTKPGQSSCLITASHCCVSCYYVLLQEMASWATQRNMSFPTFAWLLNFELWTHVLFFPNTVKLHAWFAACSKINLRLRLTIVLSDQQNWYSYYWLLHWGELCVWRNSATTAEAQKLSETLKYWL